MDCETYITKCAEAYKSNPPFIAFECKGADSLLWAVRYFVRGCGAGLDVYPEDEAKKHLHLLWNAHIQAFFGTSHMARLGKLCFKDFIKWAMEARSESLKRMACND